jgi:AraC-like DNA-binding protein
MGTGRTVSCSLAKVILAHCEALGVASASLARDCGFEPAQLDDPTGACPPADARALEGGVARLRRPALALHIAGRSHPAMYGLVGHLAVISRSVDEALGHLCRFQRLLSDDGFWSLERGRGRLVLRFDMEVPPDADVWRQGVELSLANAVGALRFLTGRPLCPRSASFTYSDPGYRAAYAEVFGCPVRFLAKTNALEFAPEVAALPVRTANPSLATAAQREAEAALGALDAGKPTQAAAGRALVSMLPAGAVSLRAVAQALGMSARTLERRLHNDGTSFRRLLDGVRLELAQAWLREGNMGIEAIAFRSATRSHRLQPSVRKLAVAARGEFGAARTARLTAGGMRGQVCSESFSDSGTDPRCTRNVHEARRS